MGFVPCVLPTSIRNLREQVNLHPQCRIRVNIVEAQRPGTQQKVITAAYFLCMCSSVGPATVRVAAHSLASLFGLTPASLCARPLLAVHAVGTIDAALLGYEEGV